jgi:DNA-binding PadR family transcriptional regulator
MGPFEENVLISVLALEPEAYGLVIQRKLTELYLGKDINLGSVYVTLERLQSKEYVESFEQRANGRGQTRRCYRLTPEGQKALKESARVQKRSLSLLERTRRKLRWDPI